MSKGIGKEQLRILRVLQNNNNNLLSVDESCLNICDF